MQKPFRIIICFLSVFACTAMVRPGSLSKIITVIIPVPRTGTRLRGEFLYPVPLLLFCLILFSEKYKNSLSQQLCRQGDLYILFFFLFFSLGLRYRSQRPRRPRCRRRCHHGCRPYRHCKNRWCQGLTAATILRCWMRRLAF